MAIRVQQENFVFRCKKDGRLGTGIIINYKVLEEMFQNVPR